MPGPNLHILHITPWFPTADNPSEAIWIKRHIELLDVHHNTVLHYRFFKGAFKIEIVNDANVLRMNIHIPIERWRIKEWVLAVALQKFFEKNKGKFELANFHIAYPALVHFDKFKNVLPPKLLITEHWSFYKFHFYSTRKLTRIKRIFHRNIPLICVSQSLADDISNFSGVRQNAMIVPNIVDKSIFKYDPYAEQQYYFSAAKWGGVKKPLELLRDWSDPNNDRVLIIAGTGPFEIQMKEFVIANGIAHKVKLLGQCTEEQLAKHMQKAKAFILPTGYETFSVVCAEARSCGCPVITENVGALGELINERNGIFRSPEESWLKTVIRFENEKYFDRKIIGEEAKDQFSPQQVRKLYLDIIDGL